MNPIISYITDLTNFGAAGLMGALWVWERRLGRTREQQLSAAHERVLRDEQRLDQLTRVVEHNTAAMTRFAEGHREMIETLKDLARELRHG